MRALQYRGNSSGRHWPAWLVFPLWSLLAGCAGDAPRPGSKPAAGAATAQLAWPPAPATARILHVAEVSQPRDLGVKVSVWNRVSNFLSGGNRGTVPLVTPSGVAVDDAGNLCVTDTGAGAVLFFDLAASKCARWEKLGNRRFVSPIAVAKTGDRVFVSDAGRPALVAFNTGGKLLFELTNQLQRATGLAILGDTLYVADAPAHAVAAFDLAGNPRFRFGQRGVGPGELNFPTHLATDGRDRVYVTDSMNSRVQAFNAAGQFQSTISGRGDSSGRLNRPKGLAVDTQGHLYVVDALFDNFQIFDPAGRFLLNVGSSGAGPGEFWLPAGIAINQKNQIFVADSYNRRVQVFQYVGNP